MESYISAVQVLIVYRITEKTIRYSVYTVLVFRIYAGSCNNAIVKILIQEVPCEASNSFGCSRYGYIRLDHFRLAFISPVT